MEGGEEEKFF